ncbi:hypothetical protein Tco_0948221 [Tanacetum coccineum]
MNLLDLRFESVQADAVVRYVTPSLDEGYVWHGAVVELFRAVSGAVSCESYCSLLLLTATAHGYNSQLQLTATAHSHNVSQSYDALATCVKGFSDALT